MAVIRDIAVDKKDAEYIAYIDRVQKELKDTINDNCWEEDRFIRGFKEDGQVIGSKKDRKPVCGLTLSLGLLLGLATKEQAEKALEMSIESLIQNME